MTAPEFAAKYPGARLELAWIGAQRFGTLVGWVQSRGSVTDERLAIVLDDPSDSGMSHYDSEFWDGLGWTVNLTRATQCEFTIVGVSEVKILQTNTRADRGRYPQTCRCGSPAYISALTVDCSSPGCRHFRP